METTQLYSIVNSINKQTMGETAIQAVDTASFIAMGNSVLSSAINTEAWLNTLLQRIGKTIISFRPYTNKMSELAFTDMQWGAIMQKIKVEMPEAVEDVSVELEDGESVDHYIVAKPQAKQKIFVVRSPYTFFVTIQRKWLYEAFLSEGAMEQFIAAIFGELQNKLELSQENLGRLCLANFIANMGDSQKIHLLTDYNTLSGQSITGDKALIDNGFLRYAMGQMRLYSEYLQTMSTLYNKEKCKRHTPLRDQRFVTRADFKIAMETQVEYAAFHEGYLQKVADITVPYWQSADDRGSIIIDGGEGEDIKINNILGIIHDREALGTFRKSTDVLTTPVNARGAYYNTFYHTDDARFNDLSENAILFLLD